MPSKRHKTVVCRDGDGASHHIRVGQKNEIYAVPGIHVYESSLRVSSSQRVAPLWYACSTSVGIIQIGLPAAGVSDTYGTLWYNFNDIRP